MFEKNRVPALNCLGWIEVDPTGLTFHFPAQEEGTSDMEAYVVQDLPKFLETVEKSEPVIDMEDLRLCFDETTPSTQWWGYPLTYLRLFLLVPVGGADLLTVGYDEMVKVLRSVIAGGTSQTV